MNNLVVTNVSMTSLELAEVTGKKHKNILRDIRNEIAELGEEICKLKFEPTSYVDSWNREQEMYTLNKSGVMQLVLKYYAIARHKVLEKLEELERGQAIQASQLSP